MTTFFVRLLFACDLCAKVKYARRFFVRVIWVEWEGLRDQIVTPPPPFLYIFGSNTWFPSMATRPSFPPLFVSSSSPCDWLNVHHHHLSPQGGIDHGQNNHPPLRFPPKREKSRDKQICLPICGKTHVWCVHVGGGGVFVLPQLLTLPLKMMHRPRSKGKGPCAHGSPA